MASSSAAVGPISADSIRHEIENDRLKIAALHISLYIAIPLLLAVTAAVAMAEFTALTSPAAILLLGASVAGPLGVLASIVTVVALGCLFPVFMYDYLLSKLNDRILDKEALICFHARKEPLHELATLLRNKTKPSSPEFTQLTDKLIEALGDIRHADQELAIFAHHLRVDPEALADLKTIVDQTSSLAGDSEDQQALQHLHRSLGKALAILWQHLLSSCPEKKLLLQLIDHGKLDRAKLGDLVKTVNEYSTSKPPLEDAITDRLLKEILTLFNT